MKVKILASFAMGSVTMSSWNWGIVTTAERMSSAAFWRALMQVAPTSGHLTLRIKKDDKFECALDHTHTIHIILLPEATPNKLAARAITYFVNKDANIGNENLMKLVPQVENSSRFQCCTDGLVVVFFFGL
jgi:hypothetical protein